MHSENLKDQLNCTKLIDTYLKENNTSSFLVSEKGKIIVEKEFKVQKEMGQYTPEFEKFLSDRKIGHIVVDKPLLIQTTTMHRVVVTEAPRCAWITRWNNIPKDVSFQQFKRKVENIL